jgi:hypothetical protein
MYPRRVRSRATGALVLLVALAGAGCGDDIALIVELRTDFRPGLEFDEVTVQRLPRLPGGDAIEPIADRAVAAAVTDDWIRGHRVAEFGSLSAGSHVVRVRLRAAGSTLAERLVLIELDASYALVVTITRSCREVSCPPGDDPDATECVGGQCTSPRCARPGEGECPNGCVADGECDDGATCGAGRCEAGVCLLEADDAICDRGAGERCIPDEGCVVVGVPDDAGSADAGPTDGGPLDGGPPDGGPADAGPPDAGCTCTVGEARAPGGRCDVCSREVCQSDCRSWACELNPGAECEHQGGGNFRMCTTGSGATGAQFCLDRRPDCIWSTQCCVLSGGGCNVTADCCAGSTCSGSTCG